MSIETRGPATDDRSECLLLLQGIVGGWARWEPLPGGGGEVCAGGIRYATDVGADGLPVITPNVVAALFRARRGEEDPS